MKEARISEIFLSLQGEGIYVGIPQVFVRFYGCGLSCVFCDTNPDSYKIFKRDALISKLLEYKDPYHSVSLTGGEPLVQTDFIEDFLREYKKFYKKQFYLETNGILYKKLSRVIEYIDIIAMDFKLPSSTGMKAFWEEHERFLEIARKKKTFVKTIVTARTESKDIIRMAEITKKVAPHVPVVLQPVTTLIESEKVRSKDLEHFRNIIASFMPRIEVIHQVHKMIGAR
ncbi:MAG: 7-carboxy-7-deazaguanine synthase QueE [Candidatus Omnitrophica bacterium]|nr:7-carboxy-7-deazaguanine synthase QueE [Candidatus Omnitrophota bacterium]